VSTETLNPTDELPLNGSNAVVTITLPTGQELVMVSGSPGTGIIPTNFGITLFVKCEDGG